MIHSDKQWNKPIYTRKLSLLVKQRPTRKGELISECPFLSLTKSKEFNHKPFCSLPIHYGAHKPGTRKEAALLDVIELRVDKVRTTKLLQVNLGLLSLSQSRFLTMNYLQLPLRNNQTKIS